MTAHVETIGFQNGTVRRVSKHILPHIGKDLHSMEYYLVPMVTYLAHENVHSRLKQVATKHSQMWSSIKAHEIDGCNDIDNMLPPGSEIISRKLIVGIKAECGERFTVTTTWNCDNVMELWATHKCKKHASAVVSHFLARSLKPQRHIVLTSFSIEDQIIALETKWNRNVPLDMEEVEVKEIEDTEV